MEPARPHVVVVNVPEHGHVNPTLAVVTELVRRGCRVSYAVAQQFAPQVRAAGAMPVIVPVPERAAGASSEDLCDGVDVFVGEAEAALPVLEAAFADDRPDAVLYDLEAFAGKALARKWGLPGIELSPTHALFPGWERAFLGLNDLSEMPCAPHFQRFLDDNGLDCTIGDFVQRSDAKVVFVPRTFQVHADLMGPEHSFVGPALGDRSSFQGSWRAPVDGRPVLLVSLGSVFTDQPEFFRQCLEAASRLDWHTVIAVGRHVDPATLGTLPAHVEVHASVPQLDVLAAASAFVTHAGMGSVLEALHFGVPMVAVPQMAEQRVNARRLEQLGLGVYLPREQADASALLSAVRQVSGDPRVAAAVSAMREDVRACGGAAAAADVVEAVAGLKLPATARLATVH
ncbi:macrolide family glycosyltransferase [Streptacidiphilus pinicola]|uniref:macrolide family glycosyltransferase n=1 Tax=Streptacidiphilus pinicola TaxID=2219663 RepID=UPI001FB4E386|nr:macrolide family glycosyltransferase [Streptacidiphilus pinicola]